MLKTILVDMDGVVADLMGNLATKTTLHHPICKWHFYGCCMPENAIEIMNTDISLFEEAPEISGAIEGVKELAKYHTVRFVSTPWPGNSGSAAAKINWLTTRGFSHEQIILAWDKTLIKGDLLIDDKPGLIGPWPVLQYPQSWNIDDPTPKCLTWDEGLAQKILDSFS